MAIIKEDTRYYEKSERKIVNIEEAKDFVRDYFEENRIDEHDGVAFVVKDLAFQLTASNGELSYSKEKISLLLEESNTSFMHYDAALLVAINILERHEQLPGNLGEWLANHLKGTIKRPARSGPNKYKNLPRDFAIAMAVYKLIDKGFFPTRNDSSEANSACDVVSSVIGKLGYNLGYDAVKKIWNSYSHLR